MTIDKDCSLIIVEDRFKFIPFISGQQNYLALLQMYCTT